MKKKMQGPLEGLQIRPFILIIIFIILLIIWQFHSVNELENYTAGKPSPTKPRPAVVMNKTMAVTEVSSGSPIMQLPNEQKAGRAPSVITDETKAVSNSAEVESQESSLHPKSAGVTVSPAMGNSIPNQEQIAEGIRKQIAMRQRVEKAVGERKRKIEEVHQSIINSGVLNTMTQNKPFVEPNLDTPQDIVDKIRSKQLTAH